MSQLIQESVRIDKWLWAVRLFKTRSLATQSCSNGKIFIGENKVKPSYQVKSGQIVFVNRGGVKQEIKVISILEKRVGAKLVKDYMEDITSPDVVAQLLKINSMNYEKRNRGEGRPTKKNRREIEKLKEV